MLTRKDVAAQNNGIVRVKKTGEVIGAVSRRRHRQMGAVWQPSRGVWMALREDAIAELLRVVNEKP